MMYIHIYGYTEICIFIYSFPCGADLSVGRPGLRPVSCPPRPHPVFVMVVRFVPV